MAPERCGAGRDLLLRIVAMLIEPGRAVTSESGTGTNDQGLRDSGSGADRIEGWPWRRNVRPSAWTAGWAVLRNELRIWFLSPAGWVFLAAYLFLAGLFFTLAIATTGEASLRPALPNLAVTLVFTLPLVTMRQLADEARSGTLELLLTAPVPLHSLLIGKWAATMALCCALLAATFPFLLVLVLYGDPDPGVLVASYLGLLCCCAAFAAVGLFSSATTRDPMVAGVVAVLILLPSWLASSARELAPPSLAPALERASFVEHLRSFSRGVLDTGDLAWFGLVTAVFLFLTWRVLESRRWR